MPAALASPSQLRRIDRLMPKAVRTEDDSYEIWEVSCEFAGVPAGTLAGDMPQMTSGYASRLIGYLEQMAARRRCEHCGAHLRDRHDIAQHSLVDYYGDGSRYGPACGLS